jgi:hypothetical protein
MKQAFFVALAVAANAVCFGQADTIFSNNEKIPCLVKEITPDAVKFVYLKEEMVNAMYKNAIQKIVFKNGRTQTFSEASALRKVIRPDNYEHVTITQLESEVKGLFKIGEVSAKAKGTTRFSNQDRVKKRAYRKMKSSAAMMGANTVYLLHQRDEGNRLGGVTAETSLTGVAYSNVLPNFEEFSKLIEGKKKFIAIQEVTLFSGGSKMNTSDIMIAFEMFDLTNVDGRIMMNGILQTQLENFIYRVVSFDKDHFYLYYETKDMAYNIKVRII